MKHLISLAVLTFTLWNVSVAQSLENCADVIVFGGTTCTASIGSLRLAQKIGKNVGDTIVESRDGSELLQKCIDSLGSAGTIYLVGEIGLSKPVVLPYPSYFKFVGGSLWSGGGIPLIVFKKKDKVSKHAILQMDHIEMRGRGKNPSFVDVEGGYHILTHSVDGSGAEKVFYFKDCNGGMKLIEFSYAMAIGKIPFDMDSDFTTIICPEGFSGFPKYKFGPGGMLIGGHTATVGGLRTYQLPEKTRDFYPSTVLAGSCEGYDTCWTADGACLVLIGTSKSAAKKGYLEENGGKIIFVGEDWDK